MIYKNMILFILFNLYNSLNIRMCINNNNNYNNNNNNKNNYNLPIKKLQNGEHVNLILLNNVITSEWCKNWIYDMSLYKKNEDCEYPQFMFTDMMSMRIYCETNKDDNFFYVGYIPKNINTINGPLYIGAFKLIEGKRIFNIENIIQNPSNTYSDITINDFRNDLYHLGAQSNCIMNITPLKNFSNSRYWLDFRLF